MISSRSVAPVALLAVVLSCSDGSKDVGPGSAGKSSTGTGGAPGLGGSAGASGPNAGRENAVGGGGTAAGGASAGRGAAGGPSSGGSGAATSGRGGTGGVSGAMSVGGSPAAGTGGQAGTEAEGGAGGGGAAPNGGMGVGGKTGTGGAPSGGASCSGPVGKLTGALATGIQFNDTDGVRVNAHGGGIIRVGSTFYLHGEYFPSGGTDNNFHGFTLYSSPDLATWKNEGVILPTQASGELGPNRKGERPHIIQCPKTGEFVLYAHAASEDYQMDREVVFATSATVNGQYAYQGPLKNAGGSIAAHSDMSAYADDTGAYVVTESGHVYTLADDCHSWLSDKSYGTVNGDSGGSESPTIFRAGSTYYWIGSYKTGWRANNNFYSTAPAMSGPWTYQGFLAPVDDAADDISDERTWLTQSTWVQPVQGCSGTVYVYWGDHWNGNLDTTAPGKHNDLATYVFQPLVFDGTKISLPTYHESWNLDVGAGSWSE